MNKNISIALCRRQRLLGANSADATAGKRARATG